MPTPLEIIFIGDQDSYESLWLNGENHGRSTDNFRSEDILRVIADFANKNGGISEFTVHTFSIYDASTGDIPEDINTLEGLQEWHRSVTGEDMRDGW